MELNFKLTYNIPEELIKALGINEDTLFCTSYEDGTLCVETVNEEDAELIDDIPAEATDTYRLGYEDGYDDNKIEVIFGGGTSIVEELK